MLEFFRKRRAQRAVDKAFKEVMDEGLPSAFSKDASAGYLASLALSRHLYMRLFFGKNRFVKSSDAGRADRDKSMFAALVAVMFASFASFLRIDKEQVSTVIGWQLMSIPEVWHEHLIGLTEALVDEAGDLSFQSNSILAFMKQISNGGSGSEDQVGFLDGMVFHTVYLAHATDAQKQFKRIRSALDR